MSNKSKKVVMVAQMGERLDAGPRYGTLNATLAAAKAIHATGCDFVLLIASDEPAGRIEGIPFIGFHDENHLGQILASMDPIDTLIGISRADIFRKAEARRRLVYHHGPHPIQEVCGGSVAASAINTAGVQVVCPSASSKQALIAGGISADLVHVVPNGYDQRVFKLNPNVERSRHSMIFAGTIVPYKGVDVALQAYKIVKRKFPDATFSLYGRPGAWSDREGHVMEKEWLGAGMMPDWKIIEAALPGVFYRGEASPEELARAFQAHSLLVMPSRLAETFGIVSLEAQACGCIPVLPRKGGFVETVRDGVTGYFYTKEDPEGLAAAVADLWERDFPLESQRLEAAAVVSTSYSWERTGQEFLDIMRHIPLRTERFRNRFVRIWIMNRIKTAVSETLKASYWSVMRWTKPFRQAIGLSKRVSL